MQYFDQDPSTPSPAPPSPNDELKSGQRHLLLELVYFNFLVLIAAGGASYILARKTLAPIEAAHEQQKRFTADVSHELRTPLTALKMESEVALLDKDASKTHLRHTLSSNLEEAEKLETLINNLLRLSQLELTQAQESFSVVSLHDVVSQASSNLQVVAKKRQITFKKNFDEVSVTGDATTLEQLATIIIDNSIKYSTAKSKITIATKRTGNNAQLIVSDTGIGIETAALPHIFDRFYRADKARGKAESQGYGLGLSLAKMIVELHHGSIHITSQTTKPHNGTTVTVTLPLPPKKSG